MKRSNTTCDGLNVGTCVYTCCDVRRTVNDEVCEYYARAVLPGYNLTIGICCKDLVSAKSLSKEQTPERPSLPCGQRP